jgi:uncharacterized membrane protein YphA (DoxX/SURF4 family)
MQASLTQSGASGRWLARGSFVARGIFVAVFAMALFFKLTGIATTAEYIGAAGFPAPLLLTWLAVVFESLLVICLATGYRFRQAALAAGAYVIFLAFAFHGPSKWAANQMEFGFFIDHFTFLAGLLYAAAYGPGERRRKGITAQTPAAGISE